MDKLKEYEQLPMDDESNDNENNNKNKNKKKKTVMVKGIKAFPLCDAQPFFVGLAIFHVKEGISARIFQGMLGKLNEGRTSKREHRHICSEMKKMTEAHHKYLNYAGMEQMTTRLGNHPPAALACLQIDLKICKYRFTLQPCQA